MTQYSNFLDAAFFSNVPVDFLQPQCASNSQFSVPLQLGSATLQQGSFYGHIFLSKMFITWRTIIICGLLDTVVSLIFYDRYLETSD